MSAYEMAVIAVGPNELAVAVRDPLWPKDKWVPLTHNAASLDEFEGYAERIKSRLDEAVKVARKEFGLRKGLFQEPMKPKILR